MERQTGCPKHGLAEIKKNLNDYVCMHDEKNGICGYRLNKVETANYIQIKSEVQLEKSKEHLTKGELILSDQKLAELPEEITLREFKSNLEIKSWFLVDQFFEGKAHFEKAKVAILALGLLIKEKQLAKT
jgi:hypothetical protein